jgi:hypothetical protein
LLGLAEKEELTRPERLALLYMYDRKHAASGYEIDHIVWPANTISTCDPRDVHALVRVHFRGSCLVSAFGRWLPQTEQCYLRDSSEILLDVCDDDGDGLTFTTPEPIFGDLTSTGEHAEINEPSGWYRDARGACARLLGTDDTPRDGGEPTSSSSHGLRADLMLIQVCRPIHEGQPRRLSYCTVLDRPNEPFITQWSANEDCFALGIQYDDCSCTTKVEWALASSYAFRKEKEESAFDWNYSGHTSDDHIMYGDDCLPDSWLNIFIEFKSDLNSSDDWNSGEHHAVTGLSIGGNWGSGDIQGRTWQDLLPCRQRWLD